MQITDQAFEFPSMFGLDRRSMNGTLTPARNGSMLELLGLPRGRFDAECREVENPILAERMTTLDLGPCAASGLQPVLEALTQVFAQVSAAHPALFGRIGLTEALCCRMVAGSNCVISNHAWGAAVTLSVDGGQDPAFNPAVRSCLLAIAPIFIRHGFFWGAAHAGEDPLTFELSEQLLQAWAQQGRFGRVPYARPAGLAFGDRGPEVEQLQHRLNRALAPCRLDADGLLGPATRAAVMEFQRREGFKVDGLVSRALDRVLARRARAQPRRRAAARG